MIRDLKLLVFLFVSINFSSCTNTLKYTYLKHINSELKEQKKNFGRDYTKENLLDHFPEKLYDIDTTKFSFYSGPPSCPPSFPCSKQSGGIYLICKMDSTNNEISNGYLYQNLYTNDSNLIIDRYELVREELPLEKCNKAFSNKYPIPLFEEYDFSLGTEKIEIKIDWKVRERSLFIIPEDLEVYVIKAETGGYWKVSCNEKRPESLKEWKQGYSKGIAISKEKEIIVYWTMIW